RLSYAEEGKDRALSLSNLDAKLSGFSLKGGFFAKASGSLSGRWDGRALDGSAAFDGTIDLGGGRPEAFMARIRTLTARAGPWRLKASGSVENLSRPRLDVAIDASGPQGTSARLRYKGTVTPPAQGVALAAAGQARLQSAALTAGQAESLGLPKGLSLPAFRLDSDFQYGADALELNSLALSCQRGRLEASGRLSRLSSGRPQPALNVSAKFDLPALSAKQAPWLGLPAGLGLPAMTLEARGRINGDSLSLEQLALRGGFGSLKASGSARRLYSSRPSLDLSLALNLSLPALQAAQLPWAGLPPRLRLPAMTIEGAGRLQGEQLTLDSLRLGLPQGSVSVSGVVRGLRSGSPAFALNLAAKLTLPALSSADDPFGTVPPGLSIPASRWDASLWLSRDEVRIASLRAVVGHNELSVDKGLLSGLRRPHPFVDLTLKCRRFKLDELTGISLQTRGMDLRGGGFFAIALRGRLPRPVMRGKARFQDVAATVGGLQLSGFSGTASFNESRIDVPDLRGRVGDGDLDLNLTVSHYEKAPDIDLEASLSRFDLGKFLAAKAALASRAPAKPERAGRPSHEAAAPISARGKLLIGELVHPNASASDVRVKWNLTGITPDLSRLAGTASLYSSKGSFANLGEMATQSKIVKILILPLMVVQKIGSLGGIRLFPDLNAVHYDELAGDYAFSNGIMTVRDSHIDADVGDLKASGRIDLPRERLDLAVTAQVGRLAPIDVAVGGTFEKPSTHVKLVKFLAEPAKQLLEGLLNR
ncbi:MAG: hypothetical protein KGK30_04385, partial [Elusimicrobia bacterium]|nr:hypothetical protein [Elusimicrobiota bacterium]